MTERERENALLRRVDRALAAQAREEYARETWAQDFARAWNAQFWGLLAYDEKVRRDARRGPRARGLPKERWKR